MEERGGGLLTPDEGLRKRKGEKKKKRNFLGEAKTVRREFITRNPNFEASKRGGGGGASPTFGGYHGPLAMGTFKKWGEGK